MLRIALAQFKSPALESGLSDVTFTVPSKARLYHVAADSSSSKVKVVEAAVARTAVEPLSAISEVMILLAWFNYAPPDGTAMQSNQSKTKLLDHSHYSPVADISTISKKLSDEDDDEKEVSQEEIAKEEKASEDKAAPAPPAPEAPDDAGERRTKIKRMLMFLACTVVCIVIVVIILWLFVLQSKFPAEKLACESAACHEVVHIMEGFEDLSIKPCDDLYRHACGYWLTRTSNPSSFMEDVARNYSRILRNVLSDGGARSDSNLYLNITFKTWLETANKQAMLNALVDLSVRFRLHSFFRVDVIEHLEAPPTWYIERGWAFMYCISGRVVVDVRDRAASYLADVLRVVDANAATNSTVTRVIELDIARMTESTDNDDQRDAIDQKVPLGNLTCDIFHDGVSWLRALQTVPGDTQKLTANTTVHVSSFKA
ncbi:hypothetical protein HPB51_029243 [Rhipicephalus microplus]|uniref:Peptidase M13 N-terminal domain-containing protein n=1 Tax=Rhipicephalus microplus TaxID=6941 RepID=A0A9J6CV39_RHIMP|nr:hypothetical protein HPB51_029243 [Rhipicephalus microplus]